MFFGWDYGVSEGKTVNNCFDEAKSAECEPAEQACAAIGGDTRTDGREPACLKEALAEGVAPNRKKIKQSK